MDLRCLCSVVVFSGPAGLSAKWFSDYKYAYVLSGDSKKFHINLQLSLSGSFYGGQLQMDIQANTTTFLRGGWHIRYLKLPVGPICIYTKGVNFVILGISIEAIINKRFWNWILNTMILILIHRLHKTYSLNHLYPRSTKTNVSLRPYLSCDNYMQYEVIVYKEFFNYKQKTM